LNELCPVTPKGEVLAGKQTSFPGTGATRRRETATAARVVHLFGCEGPAPSSAAGAGPRNGSSGHVSQQGLNAVLDESLRTWVMNRATIDDVYANIDNAIRLVYEYGSTATEPD
jgi:hypothetical protein